MIITMSTQDNDNTPDGQILLRSRTRTKKPQLYKVILLNDDYTPMDFVVTILKRFFQKSEAESMDIMMRVHRKGSAVCGVYSHEIAETRVNQVLDYARLHEHPLQCTMEPE
jgi:ATP-dependent Clp protease adaptor protein ClpS